MLTTADAVTQPAYQNVQPDAEQPKDQPAAPLAGKTDLAYDAGQPLTHLRLGYLLSQYPAVSHTFLLHEVLGLRARGIHIATASINRPDRPLDRLPPFEAGEAASTHYIKSGRWLASALLILQTAILHPRVTLRGLGKVLLIPGLTLRKRVLWLFYLAEALLVGRWLRNERLQHLHVHFGGPVASVGLLVSHAWRIPYSLTIHGPEELLNHESYHLHQKVTQASFVLCISDFCLSQLYQITPPAHWPKFYVSRLGVDPAVLSPVQRRANPSSPEPPLQLVCTGRLVAAKGHAILLQALLLLARRGIEIETTLIGSGPEREHLERFTLRNGLTSRVRFTGALSHPETLKHVCRADLFVLASFAEGVPVAFMEAMALAVACVGTSIAGIPELIRTGRDGLLVPPANVEELADAIASLAQDAALRRRLGASGRERVIAVYNLPLNHERLAGLFARLTLPARAGADAGDNV